MLSAIRLSVSLVGSTTASNVANASVMLCATVNEVTILTSERKLVGGDQQPHQKRQMVVPGEDVLDAEPQEVAERPAGTSWRRWYRMSPWAGRDVQDRLVGEGAAA